MNKFKNHPLTPVYITWFLLAIFYAYQYFLRVTPSVMIKDVCSAFSLNAEQFSLIPAFYLYAYGILQIPMGFILDIVGIKKTMLLSMIVSILGVLLFYTTHDTTFAYASRFLIGLGAAGTFIAPLKLAGDHLTPGKRGMIMGLTLTIGTMGALLAGRPQSILMKYCGWRELGLWSAIGGLVILLLMILFIPRSDVIDIKNTAVNAKKINHILKNIKQALNNKNLLVYGTLAFGLYAPLTVLSDTWGVTYIAEKFNYSNDIAAGCVSYIFIGLCIGSFVIPGFYEKKKMINKGIIHCVLLMCISFSIILFFQSLHIFWVKAFLFLFGFFSGAEMLCFAGISHVSSHGNRGISLGIANTINMTCGAMLQQVVGKLIDYFWSGELTSNGIRVYAQQDLEKALMSFILIFILTFLVALLLRHDHE